MANFLSTNVLNTVTLRTTLRFLQTKHCLFSTTQKVLKNDDVFEEADKKVNESRALLENLADRGTHWEYHQEGCGAVYDKKPFKVLCKQGKMYMWCACGWSKRQPFCDGTHAIQHYKITMKPVPFTCKETKEYWFCNCKQTKHRPFCDGTHKTEEVKKANSVVKQ